MHLPSEIADPVTGERIVFDESASSAEQLVWDEFRPANVEPPPRHYHPDTEERFQVREGLLVVEIDDTEHRVETGEEIVVPPETPHVSYTDEEPAHFRREVTPPGQWRAILTDRFAVGHAVGDLSGVMDRLQKILLIRAYPDVIVPERPPRTVRRVLFPVLAAVARAMGLKAHYPYPRDDATNRWEHEQISQT